MKQGKLLILGFIVAVVLFGLWFESQLVADKVVFKEAETQKNIMIQDELLYRQYLHSNELYLIRREKAFEIMNEKLMHDEMARAADVTPPPTSVPVEDSPYPVAAIIWNYLRAQGYNEAVCAGIIGNMMVEAGGNTLAIQPVIYGHGFYGICQWNQAYGSVWGTDLDTQLNFLMSNIVYELNTFGYAYYSGFGYNSFCSLTSPSEAALAFAKCYERCGSGSYGARQQCAEYAYSFFVGG